MKLSFDEFPDPPENLNFGEVHLRFVQIFPCDPSRDFVPYYHFRILILENTDVGHINFRVGDTEHIRRAAGHIGYGIDETFRGHRLAFQACRAIAPFVRLFYDVVLITSDPGNIASIRTIERLGARLIDEMTVPENDPHYERGSRIKKRYQWEP